MNSSDPPGSPTLIPPRTSSHANGLTHARKSSRSSKSYPEGDRTVHSAVGSSNDTASGNILGSSPEYSDRKREKEKRRSFGDSLVEKPQTSWTAEKENILFGPYEYMLGNPGKDIRTQLITAFDAWLNVPKDSLKVITNVVGMLHTASLLVDDVEDSSLLRRGVPVAHSIFGTAQTINSANYVYFCALQELQKLNNPYAIHIYTEELLNLHRGQGMDLFWRDTLTCPSEDDYLEMVGNKTGGLFRLAVKLMQAESSNKTDYVPLVNLIGLIFQILDDYKNLFDTTYTKNKGLCEDLTEGKFSFPVIHSIRSNPQNLVLINILKQKTTDEEVKRYAVRYMETTGSFSYTRKVLRDLARKATNLIDEMDGDSGRKTGILAIIEKLKVEQARPRSMET